MSKKNLTQRAVQLIRANAPSGDLIDIKREVSQRIQEVDAALKLKQVEVDRVMGDGDLDALKAFRQGEAELRDEDKMLHRQQSDLHRAIEIAHGEEAMRGADQHRKALAKSLKQSRQAQDMLQESQLAIRKIIQARRHAEEIGQALVFDADVIRELANLTYFEGNEKKQCKIDLGILAAMQAAA